jgi:spore coat polysaccharide biosynthesis protein SpsF
MKILTIIQARLNSTRLPGKMLLPIGTSPSLAARVISNASKSELSNKTILATSTENSDNKLYEHINNLGLNVFRGDLANVLKRFYDLATIEQADIVVRLTGDCPLITGDWIDNAISVFLELREKEEIDYLGYPEELPDGLDIEIFTYEALKKAYSEASNEIELEHVTPYIWKHPEKFSQKKLPCRKNNYSLFRLSIDTKSDYDFIGSLLQEVDFETHTDLFEYLDKNRTSFLTHAVKSTKNAGFLSDEQEKLPNIMLGLAAVGQNYGWSKSEINTDYSNYFDLFYSAYISGIKEWDTAPLYGESEQIVGAFIKESKLTPDIYTKCSIPNELRQSSLKAIIKHIEESINTSIDTLNITPKCLQIHNADEDILKNTELLLAIKDLLGKHKIAKFGVTVYGLDLLTAYQAQPIDLIQFEYNMARTTIIKKLFLDTKINANNKLAARSILNKGLFVAKTINELDSYFDKVKPKLKTLYNLANEMNISVLELAIRYAISTNCLDYIILGMKNIEEVNSNIQIYKKGALSKVVIEKIDAIGLNDYWKILDPRRW